MYGRRPRVPRSPGQRQLKLKLRSSRQRRLQRPRALPNLKQSTQRRAPSKIANAPRNFARAQSRRRTRRLS